MKFKVGDVVIVTSGRPSSARDMYPYYEGKVFTVGPRSIEYNVHSLSHFSYFEEDDENWTVQENRLELLDVYNSPLYKVMREDE